MNFGGAILRKYCFLQRFQIQYSVQFLTHMNHFFREQTTQYSLPVQVCSPLTFHGFDL